MNLNEAKQLLNRSGYKLIKEDAGNDVDLTVYIYDDGYRPPKDEIEDNDAAKDWIYYLDWEVRSGHCYETKYTINQNNINETFERIRKSMKYHYGYSYLNGSVRGTINGNEVYENISACDIIHDLKDIFKQNGIEVEFNESKQLPKKHSYQLIKEGAGISSKIIQALTSNGWELVKSLSKYIVTAPAKLVFTHADGRFLTLKAQSDDQQTWVAIVDDTNDPEAEEDVKGDLSYDDIINLFA